MQKIQKFKYAVALTGSIATGKSTACSMLKLLGFHIIDTDKIAHQLLDANSEQIAAMFGQSVVSKGSVNRFELAKIVFHNPVELKRLEEFIHPLIYKQALHLANQQDKFAKPYLIDIPLFFEKNRYEIERSIVVYTTKEIQIKRLMKRDGLSFEEANKRIALQLDIERKKEKATYIIDNCKDITHLHQECERVKKKILEDFKCL